MAKVPPALAKAMKENPVQPPQDKLDALREQVALARDLELQKAALEEQLSSISQSLGKLYRVTLPTMLDEAHVPAITLDAEGNMPAVEVKAMPFYSANIAVSWPPERRQTAFQWLDDNGHSDLIKTEVIAAFPREARENAIKFAAQAEKYDANTSLKEAVNSQTLTAWLKEQVEAGFVPPLEIIGGVIGRHAKLKVKK